MGSWGKGLLKVTSMRQENDPEKKQRFKGPVCMKSIPKCARIILQIDSCTQYACLLFLRNCFTLVFFWTKYSDIHAIVMKLTKT